MGSWFYDRQRLNFKAFGWRCTVKLLFNEVLDVTNDILRPGQSYSKMYGIRPRYNEPRYNEFLDI